MREIKFRAFITYVGGGNSMFLLESFHFVGNKLRSVFTEETHRNFFAEQVGIELMQFTGLKDKNGKRIYEGDILMLGDERTGVVEFIAGCFMFAKSGFDDENICMILEDKPEIIGNVHENPELLKEGL